MKGSGRLSESFWDNSLGIKYGKTPQFSLSLLMATPDQCVLAADGSLLDAADIPF